jgi:hypothetical protein
VLGSMISADRGGEDRHGLMADGECSDEFNMPDHQAAPRIPADRFGHKLYWDRKWLEQKQGGGESGQVQPRLPSPLAADQLVEQRIGLSSVCRAEESQLASVRGTPARTTAARSAPAAAGGDDDQPLAIDRLDFDDAESARRRLQSEFGAFGAAVAEDVEDQFFAVEGSFEIDQLQIDLPFGDPPEPIAELVGRSALQFGRAAFVLGIREPDDFEIDFVLSMRIVRRLDSFEHRPQHLPPMRFHDHPLPALRFAIQQPAKPGDFGDDSVPGEDDLGGGGDHVKIEVSEIWFENRLRQTPMIQRFRRIC